MLEGSRFSRWLSGNEPSRNLFLPLDGFQKAERPFFLGIPRLVARVKMHGLKRILPTGREEEGGSRGILLASGPEFQLDFNERQKLVLPCSFTNPILCVSRTYARKTTVSYAASIVPRISGENHAVFKLSNINWFPSISRGKRRTRKRLIQYGKLVSSSKFPAGFHARETSRRDDRRRVTRTDVTLLIAKCA